MTDIKKNITIYDIAREVGVSPSLVSRVLSGKGSVSEKTRERIQAVIDKYGFRPNAIARGLQNSRTRMIGFMLPNIGNEYFSSVYYEFEKNASAQGYMTILYNGKNHLETELKILENFADARVEAVIIMGGSADAMTPDPAYVDAVMRLNERIPCIICSEQAEKMGCIGTHMDSHRTGELLVEHLLERGYRTMGILGGERETFPSVRLKEHLREYAIQRGITVRQEWLHGNSYDAQDGERAMKKLLEQPSLPRAVCCINDYVAIGAMSVAADAGLRIPEDIAVTGNNNIYISQVLKPKLTTVADDFEALGKTMFDMITMRLEGEQPRSVLIEPHLVIRSST